MEFSELRKKIATTRDKFLANYNRLHELCPECRANKKSMSVTYMGYVLSFDENGEVTDESYADRNQVICKCGWSGIIHDLVPLDPSIMQS